MSADGVFVTAWRETGERVRIAQPTGTALLIDVRARVVQAQGLIAHGEVGEALFVLEDLEDDLDAVLQP